ncbi:MAG: signal peptidase I [Hellea sp.]
MKNDGVDFDKKNKKPSTVRWIISEIKFFGLMSCVMLVFLTTVWGHYKIPSESMQPTLEVGDHLYVSKFAYGYSRHSMVFNLHKLPFLKNGKLFSKLPKRGDIAVFRNPQSDIIMIKRVIGLPGDKIFLKEGRLFINDKLVKRKNAIDFFYREHKGSIVNVKKYDEILLDSNKVYSIYERDDEGPLDITEEFIVPDGKIFFMGDNRDNSLDSRAYGGPGYVPLDHLIGRAEIIMFSFKKCKKEENLVCPTFRLMKRI